MSLTRPAILAYIALVFACGAVLGVFGDRLYSAYTVSAVPGNPKGPRLSPEEFRKNREKVLQSRLKLTDAQVMQIDLILDETRALYEEQRKRSQPELEAITKMQQEKTLSVLNAEQRVEYEKMLKEREARGKMKGGGPPGRPPGSENNSAADKRGSTQIGQIQVRYFQSALICVYRRPIMFRRLSTASSSLSVMLGAAFR